MENNKQKYDKNSVAEQMYHFWTTPSKIRTLKLIEYGAILASALIYGAYELIQSIMQ